MQHVLLTSTIYLYTALAALNAAELVPWPSASVAELAAGGGRYFGVQCMEQHCSTALNTCLMEADTSLDPEFNKDKKGVQQSQCGVMLLCLWHEEQNEESLEKKDHIPNKLSPTASKALNFARAARRERGADICTDGITAAEESPTEGSLLKCAQDFGCERVVKQDPAELAATKDIPSDDAVVQDVSLVNNMPLEKAKLSIQSMVPSCLKDHCAAELYSCDENPECNAVFSCLEINSARKDKTDAQKCTDKLMGLDVVKKNLLACAEKANCLKGETTSFVNIKDDIDSIASRARPSSLLQLSGGVVSHAEGHMTEAEAQKAFESSRQKTDEILHKVHQQMKSLNVQMEKTQADEQQGIAKLEKQKADDNKKLEADEKRYEALEAKAMEDPSKCFMEGNIPDFLEPLRNVARKAQSFADEMKKEQEELDAAAEGKITTTPSTSGFSLIQEKAGTVVDNEDNEFASAMKAESVDEERTEKHLTKANDALNQLERSVRDEARQLAIEERQDKQSSKRPKVHNLADGSIEGLSLVEEAAKKRDWETDLEEQAAEWRSLLARDSHGGQHGRLRFTARRGNDDDEDEGSGASFLQIGDKTKEQGDWVSELERYMQEDHQRVLAARSTKSKKPDEEDDDESSSSSFLENSMSVEDVRNAIHKEAEKTRELIKMLKSAQKINQTEAPQGNATAAAGPSFVEQTQPMHFNLEKANEEVRSLHAKWDAEAKKISAAPVDQVPATSDAKLEAIEKEKTKAEEHAKAVDEELEKALVSLKSDILQENKMAKAKDTDIGASSFLEIGSQSRAHSQLEKLKAELDADMARNREEQREIEDEMKTTGGQQPGSLIQVAHRQVTLPKNLTMAMAQLDALAKKLSQEYSS
ncbi:hypothetical protein FOL47_006742 [Perkinsus chesapeaki]|uniref:Uncharacterized protein n=1 Tax=Perkinsus chesapeaki TaxID=330153 RepID=A0A7J6LR28_PERCH|nr:hypothetical protein FOL47_006742 [Perkinsus chesapeaki]